MSSISTTPNVSTDAVQSSFVRIGVATVTAAVLANAVFYFAASPVVAYKPDFAPLANVSGAMIFTVVPAVVAVLLFAALRRFTDNPVRNFTVISAVVLVLSVIPDLTYIPTVADSSAAQTTVLIVMHVIAAAVIVSTLAAYGQPKTR